jgi:hypothetical protein
VALLSSGDGSHQPQALHDVEVGVGVVVACMDRTAVSMVHRQYCMLYWIVIKMCSLTCKIRVPWHLTQKGQAPLALLSTEGGGHQPQVWNCRNVEMLQCNAQPESQSVKV